MHKHRYANILDTFADSVWAITPDKLDEIVGFATRVAHGTINAHEADHLVRLHEQQEERKELSLYEMSGIHVTEAGTAVVPIHGTIQKRSSMMMEISGGMSTDLLKASVVMLAQDDDVTGVIFDVASSGGSVEGLADASAAIRFLGTVKPTASIANEMMASAAYWLGSAANAIFVTQTSVVGSLGVYQVRVDASALAAKEGVKYNIIRSAPLKGLGFAGEPMSENERKEAQRVVDQFAELFVNEIATNLHISHSDAAALADGRIHIGQTAIDIGMANAIMSLDQLVASFDSKATAEEKYVAVSEAYAAMQTSHATEVETLRTEIANSVDVAGDAAAAQFDTDEATRVSAAADKAINVDHKIVPASRDMLIAQLEADFDNTIATLDLIPVDAAKPAEINLAAGAGKEGNVDNLVEAVTDADFETFTAWGHPFYDARATA